MDTIIYDAIQIIDPANIVETVDTEPVEYISEPVSEVQIVPKWIKSNAEWWSQGEIDDDSFIQGIKFLIQEQIIDVPTKENVSLSEEEKKALEELVEEQVKVISIPDWIRNNAQWWVDNQISDDDFVKSIDWLVNNGVISIE